MLARGPASKAQLAQALGCSGVTVQRCIDWIRSPLVGGDLEFTRMRCGEGGGGGQWKIVGGWRPDWHAVLTGARIQRGGPGHADRYAGYGC